MGCGSGRARAAVRSASATVPVVEPQQPLRPLLLEIEGAGGRRLDPADAPSELCDVGAHSRVGQYAEAEGERGRADVIPSFERHAHRDGRQVGVGELPMPARLQGRTAWPARRTRPPGATAREVTQRRKETERLPVPEHPGRHIQSPGGLGDAHERQSYKFVSKTVVSACL